MPADRDALIVNETAAEIPGRGEKPDADERQDQSKQHSVETVRQEIQRRRKGKTGQVEKKVEKQKSGREMNEHRMDRMPLRFAFEEIFQLLDLTPVRDWRLRLARSRAIHLSTSVRR